MAKKWISIIALILVVVSVCAVFAGCGGEEVLTYEATTDNYRTYYQIFPYSFADSNGDGIGDINGIIAKLDYIQSMNFEGIWLTPIHQSPTYHKYDVVDYKSVDSTFGTLEDYDRLVEECHKRGMTVLLDLVINHTSDQNDWFEACYIAHKRGQTYNRYYNYYNFTDNTSNLATGWQMYDSTWAYECQFTGSMPDLNLQYILDEPEGYLAQDIKEIMEFWLIDHNVDGFRLDAVTSYFTGNTEKNTQILTWINDTAKAIKPSCYIVGEGARGNVAENSTYQSSGIDSFFAFQHGYTGTGTISYAVRNEKAAYLYSADNGNKTSVAGGIPAMFVANHDTGRAWGILQGANNVNNIKMGYGFMIMFCGTTFWYYGDEVGMNAYTNSAGEYIDENKRQPMPWGDSYTCTPVKTSTSVSDSVKYPLGTVAANLKDKDSIINYITRANALRRAFPQIARNYSENVYLSDDRSFAIVKKGEGDDAIYIAMNISQTGSFTMDLSELGNFKLLGTLSVDKTPTLKGSTLSMPIQTFAILQKI